MPSGREPGSGMGVSGGATSSGREPSGREPSGSEPPGRAWGSPVDGADASGASVVGSPEPSSPSEEPSTVSEVVGASVALPVRPVASSRGPAGTTAVPTPNSAATRATVNNVVTTMLRGVRNGHGRGRGAGFHPRDEVDGIQPPSNPASNPARPRQRSVAPRPRRSARYAAPTGRVSRFVVLPAFPRARWRAWVPSSGRATSRALRPSRCRPPGSIWTWPPCAAPIARCAACCPTWSSATRSRPTRSPRSWPCSSPRAPRSTWRASASSTSACSPAPVPARCPGATP